MADRFGSDLIDARTTGDGPVVAPSPPRPEGGARRGGAATALEPVIAGLLGPSPVNFFANNSSQFLSTLGIHVTF